MSGQTPYIGSKISLISKLDIRYEGILYTVDTNDSTIALAKVRSFGTEKRPAANPVAPRDEIFEYIIFKANDIKDLIVCDTPKMATLSGGSLPYDPAIISVSSRSAPAPTGDGVAATESAGSSRTNTPNRQSPIVNLANKAPGSSRGGYRGNRGGYQQQGPGVNRYNNYNGGYNRGNNRGRNNYGVPRVNQREKLKFENDFDFEKANEEFQEALTEKMEKLKVDGEAEEEKEQTVEQEDKTFYDKKTSFFDNISCESLEKAEGKTGRPDFRMNQVNQETFGRSAVRSLNYRRGNSFGRGGGYRGYNGYNNRGGNYNGYRNNYNNYNNRRGGNYSQNRDNQQPREQEAQPAAVSVAEAEQ